MTDDKYKELKSELDNLKSLFNSLQKLVNETNSRNEKLFTELTNLSNGQLEIGNAMKGVAHNTISKLTEMRDYWSSKLDEQARFNSRFLEFMNSSNEKFKDLYNKT